MKELVSRRRSQPPPPWAVFEDLCDPHRQPVRPWLDLRDDEVGPTVLERDHPNLVVWSSLWPTRPDLRVRFDLEVNNRGTDLRWTLLAEEPEPDATFIRHVRRRIGELINANLRYTYGQ